MMAAHKERRRCLYPSWRSSSNLSVRLVTTPPRALPLTLGRSLVPTSRLCSLPPRGARAPAPGPLGGGRVSCVLRSCRVARVCDCVALVRIYRPRCISFSHSHITPVAWRCRMCTQARASQTTTHTQFGLVGNADTAEHMHESRARRGQVARSRFTRAACSARFRRKLPKSRGSSCGRPLRQPPCSP